VKYNSEFESAYDVSKLAAEPEPGKAAIDAFFTTRGNDLYVILPRWPGASFVLKDVSGVKAATLLGSSQALQSTRLGTDTKISLPLLPDKLLHQPAWVLKVER